jgi:leader peptidase (prepilin peptidase)/N-methyltransferase
MNYTYWQWAILMAVLIPSSVTDIKTHKISCLLIIGSLPCTVMLDTLLNGVPHFFEYFARFYPGIAVLFVAHLAKECIGYGDGLICFFLGSVLNVGIVLMIIFLAFIFAALFGVIMMCFGKMKAKSKLPFVPFILLGVLICGFL